MREVLADIERLRAAGTRFAIGTLVSSRRSAPRPIGSKLVVSEAGALAGSVSGGCVEGDVAARADEVLGGGEPHLVSYAIADELAFSVGLPCGGEIDVFVAEPDPEVVARVARAISEEERVVTFTVLAGERTGAMCAVTLAGEHVGAEIAGARERAGDLLRRGYSGEIELDGVRVFAEAHEPALRLVVIGAVDTAEALCRQAATLGWRTYVVDARSAFATRERMPSAGELIVSWPAEALDAIAPDDRTAIAVLTHDEKFDVPALKSAFATEAFYIGAIGSRRTQDRRQETLVEEGATQADLERISGPCGLDVGASSPAETAVSILAEILAVRTGRAGGRLRDGKGSIQGRSAAPKA
jgi:xanthine dehydrogenase accessory factor